jgi:hypothetical protein|tara:strand:+ start:4717 stop:5043 length:327 start_codon:yes stop_codon:yes gene_type:complete
MKEDHRECIEEVQELMLAINETIKKYDLSEEVIVALSVAFLDFDNKSVTPDNEEVTVRMNLLSSITVDDEEELEDILSYMLDSYRKEQDNNPSNINYWINRMNNGDLN